MPFTDFCRCIALNFRLFRERDARARIVRPIVVAVLSLTSAVAVAQVLPKDRPDAGRILEQTREPLRLPPPAEDDVRPRPPEPKPAATKVRAYHRERGYFLAQAYLPRQAIREVEIAVIEGRIGVVELQRRPATRRYDRAREHHDRLAGL